jgi:hypothetical protein
VLDWQGLRKAVTSTGHAWIVVDGRRFPSSQALLAMSAWTREAVARFEGVRFGPGPRPVDPVIRVAEHLDPGRRVAGALPDDKCRLRLLDEQGDRVVAPTDASSSSGASVQR